MSPGERYCIVVAGVGGQGVLTAARCLGDAALASGRGVVVGQLHGMSQRGGSVRCTVLVGPGQSSFVPEGGADALLALEPLEGLRARDALAGHTLAVVNRVPVVPPNLVRTRTPYPEVEGILAELRAAAASLVVVDGGALVAELGAQRALNAALLGALAGSGGLPFEPALLLAAIEGRSRPEAREVNRRAFALGQEAVQG